MDRLYFFLQPLVNIGFGIMVIGLVVYKAYPDKLSSWEAGVKFLLKWVVKFPVLAVKGFYTYFYEEITGRQLPEKIVNSALILTYEEALDLTRRFDGHPYDTPALADYSSNANGVMWFDISACGLVSAYRNLTNIQIAKIASHVIQTYFMETRGCQVPLHIKVSTPTRLYFAIPLSGEGQKFLEKQEEQQAIAETNIHQAEILEEEIDLFNESEKEL